MGLQKFRADETGEPQTDGATPCYTRWIGGPTLALVRNCVCENDPTLKPRTVYVTGQPDTYFSIPAACQLRGKVVRGYLTSTDGELKFRRYLPWLTSRAYAWLDDQIGHYSRVHAMLAADGCSAEVLADYASKQARFEAARARLAARIVRRS